MSCEEGSRRRLPRSVAAAPPLDDDDLLSEILLRLAPLPSSIPRASAVCKRWRTLASDPAFSCRFRRHHRRNPPLLGFFHRSTHGPSFVPTLESPNRVPSGRFSLELGNLVWFLGCRHGLVLIFDHKPLPFLVWDPVTGQQHRLAIPSGLDLTKGIVKGAVLRCGAGDVQHFKVVLVEADNKDKQNRRWLSCVYSSETGVWGNLISTSIPSWDFLAVTMRPAVLVGDSLYWLLGRSSLSILEFDLETESLSVIRMPTVIRMRFNDVLSFTVMPAEGGGLGFLITSGFTAHVLKMKIDSNGVASWVTGRTIELGKLLSLNSDDHVLIRGFAEDNNLVFLYTHDSLFTVQLESLQFKKLTKPKLLDFCHPFECFYAAGI